MPSFPQPKDFKKFFTAEFQVPCIQAEALLKGTLGETDILAVSNHTSFNIFFNEEKAKTALLPSAKILANPKTYKKFVNEFKEYIVIAEKNIVPKYKTVPKDITKEECKKDMDFIIKFWWYYAFTEFPCLDLAYKIVKEENNKEAEKNLEEFSKFKFKGRELLNKYIFTGGVIDNLLKYLSKKFLKGDDAKYLYPDELLALYDNIKPEQKVIEQRKKCYSTAMISKEMIKYSYEEAININKAFTTLSQTNIIKGAIANKGFAKGRAVIAPLLNDKEAIQKIDNIMKKGDILIAETTSPDILMLCNKAAAIVADQGGILSHAAVVSRELNIPCIIGTEKATKLIKTGEIVEVDTKKGIVTRLQNKHKKKKSNKKKVQT